jgi:hypothetical protein
MDHPSPNVVVGDGESLSRFNCSVNLKIGGEEKEAGIREVRNTDLLSQNVGIDLRKKSIRNKSIIGRQSLNNGGNRQVAADSRKVNTF